MAATVRRIPCEDLQVGDVLPNPHLGMSPPCRVTKVIPTPLIGGGVTIHYERDTDNPSFEDGVEKLTSWCEPDSRVEVER